MDTLKRNKLKIINDPLYGFIHISSSLLFDIIEHRLFQRLRHIKQLGLTNYVYPGATHTRFQHVLGAMHLMQQTLDILTTKGLHITKDEKESATIAILLHDLGHGPFSHTLEYSLMQNIPHEKLSLELMKLMNADLNGKLDMAIEIFTNRYPKKFLHQLVSSQLDMDRLDYLRRDSFFTGVSEGVIGLERIIKMLNVADDALVVEAKGIYSIEKFLISRRIMYWQVYLHKTVVAAEVLLMQIVKRAKELSGSGVQLFASPSLQFFLQNKFDSANFLDTQPEILPHFANLDDNDLMAAIKTWCLHPDFILSTLSSQLIYRKLPYTEISTDAFSFDQIQELRRKAAKELQITEQEASYFVISDRLENKAYSITSDKINVLYKNGKVVDIAEASDVSNVSALSKTVTKYFLSHPR